MKRHRRLSDLAPEAQLRVVQCIHGPADNLVFFRDRISCRVTVWEAVLGDDLYLVTYDKTRKRLVSLRWLRSVDRYVGWDTPDQVVSSEMLPLNGDFEAVPFEPW